MPDTKVRPYANVVRYARFDDLRAGSSLSFPAPQRILLADRRAEVAPVLAAVDAATREGAWAYGYVSYDAAPGLDPRLPVRSPDPAGPPLAWFAITTEPTAGPTLPERSGQGAGHCEWRPGWDEDAYRAQVEAVRTHIAAGHTYQANLTVRMHGQLDGDPFELYRALVMAQRGAHNAYLDLGGHVIACASPELFFQRSEDEILLRPMKGTRPRGRDAAEDQALAEELWADPKERAENVMIVDLMRNDASRLAVTGSVRVPALFTVERYPTVLQLTSDITARLRPGTGLVELFTALFPCGSVTGAPKTSTMKLIAELEDTPRGVYCGAIGWIAPPSEQVSARFGVAIRTAVVDAGSGAVSYGTGSGITWSSDPAAEHAEVLTKTAVLRSSDSQRTGRTLLRGKSG